MFIELSESEAEMVVHAMSITATIAEVKGNKLSSVTYSLLGIKIADTITEERNKAKE